MRSRYKSTFYNIWPSYTDLLLGVFMIIILSFSFLIFKNFFYITILSKRPDVDISKEEIIKLQKFGEFVKHLNSSLLQEFSNDKDVTVDKDGNLTIKDSVVFDFGQHELKQEGKIKLKRIGNKIKNILDKDKSSIKYFDILVKGHTDNIGGERENWELSSQRAISVTSFLKNECKLSLPTYRVLPVGMGYFEPKVKNNTEENRAKNRRIEIKIIIPLSMDKFK
ncbi:MAG: hypothetical protein KatS3mg068_1354 [Candidatus Sericytochromatia bacterium]|nr:MAG: hypothetical protein KatS3mg068_1354 [Candidatus Sericytochromatia bacterium]